GHGGNGRGASAGRVPRAARKEAAADRRVPRTWRADGGRHRLQSRHLAAAVAAPGHAAGLHPVPADARGGAARCDRERGARPRPARPRRPASRHARRLRTLARRAAGGTLLLARRVAGFGGPCRRTEDFLTRGDNMRKQILAFAILSLLGAGSAHAQATDAARRLAQDAIIVDTHIDAPGMLQERWADLGQEAPDRELDYPRARAGGL